MSQDDGRRIIPAVFVTLAGTTFDFQVVWPAESYVRRTWDDGDQVLYADFAYIGVVHGKVLYQEIDPNTSRAVWLS